MARVRLIQHREDIAPEHHAVFEELAALRGRISGPSTVMLHSPGLARPWNDISEFLHGESIVEPRFAELAVAASARENDCGFVWNSHAGQARKAGVDETTLAAVRDRLPLDGLPEGDATVVRFVRQLLQRNRVGAPVFEALLRSHDERWLVELTAWVGRYSALAWVLNAFEVEPAAGAELLPDLPFAAPGAVDAPAPVFDAIAAAPGGVRGPFSLLLYSPDLCRRVLEVDTYLQSKSLLTASERELTVLATAQEKDCVYLRTVHLDAARKAGLPEATLAVVDAGADPAGLDPVVRDILLYVRQILRSHRVEQGLFDALTVAHGTTWLVELTALIGHYTLLASLLNAFDVGAPVVE